MKRNKLLGHERLVGSRCRAGDAGHMHGYYRARVSGYLRKKGSGRPVLDTLWIHFLQNFACIRANLGLPWLRLQQSATLRKHWLKPRFRLFYWDFSDRWAMSPALPSNSFHKAAVRAPAIQREITITADASSLGAIRLPEVNGQRMAHKNSMAASTTNLHPTTLSISRNTSRPWCR